VPPLDLSWNYCRLHRFGLVLHTRCVTGHIPSIIPNRPGNPMVESEGMSLRTGHVLIVLCCVDPIVLFNVQYTVA